jgi:uncharacterized protein YxjI
MATPRQYEVSALDLSATEYTVEQTGQDENFRPEYEATDVTGDVLFRCTYRMYEDDDEFPFVGPDGDELFTVTSTGSWDVAGDYLLTDEHTGEELVVLDNDLSFLQDTWRVRDAEDGSVLAEVDSRGALYTVARKLLPVGQWIGHEFEVSDPEGDVVGTVESGFGVFDRYEVTISDGSSVPTLPVVAGTVVIDAIQDN